MIEILGVLENKSDYSKFSSLVIKHNSDPDISRVIDNIDKFYAETGADEIDWASFETFFFVKNPMIKDTKKLVFEGIFNKLKSGCLVGGSLKSSLIGIFLERYHAERIAYLAMKVAEGKRSDLIDVQLELDDYLDKSGLADKIGEEANRDDLETILKTVSHGTGLSWRLPQLNESLGAIRKGNFLLFGGRPDSGKTTMLCSEATFMVTQLEPEQRLLYFTNEEADAVVKQRVICSLLGVTLADLESDPTRYWNEYVHTLGGDPDKILVIGKHDMNISDIEWWLKHESPGLILIDQLRKVKGFEDSKGVNRLEKLFNIAREWSKEYAPLITVTQLDGDADNEQYPPMKRLYESKTAVQGEMDAIINIGRVDGSVPANARFLNIVKNKLPTPEDPLRRNAKYEVKLLNDIARFV